MSIELFISYVPEEVIVVNAAAASFLNLDAALTWNENSPLPPGIRYYELDDLRYKILTQFGPYPPGQVLDPALRPNLTFYLQLGSNPESILLPKDSAGNIRTNVKPLPYDAWYRIREYYADDSYWTGEVVDPLNWHDGWWNGLDRGGIPRVDKVGLAAYLSAHPASAL